MKIYLRHEIEFGWMYEIVSGSTVLNSSCHFYTRKSDAKRAAKSLIKGLRTAKIVEAR